MIGCRGFPWPAARAVGRDVGLFSPVWQSARHRDVFIAFCRCGFAGSWLITRLVIR